jgi:hypothetical protein
MHSLQALLGSRQFNDQEIDETNASNAKMDSKEMEQLLREVRVNSIRRDCDRHNASCHSALTFVKLSVTPK